MKIKIPEKEGQVIIIREENDKKFYNESTFLYAVKKELIKQGYDVIKKLMYKDGNLVDDDRHYIRSRNLNQDKPFAIYNNNDFIQDSFVDFNNDNNTTLTKVFLK